jgi:thioester reductase-like protein
MMPTPRGILLTGATGLLGRYLLKDLLEADCRITVLVRDSQRAPATGRIGALIKYWRQTLGRSIPIPTVVRGDVREEGLGLSAADRRWVSMSCDAVVHAAANLSFRPSADGEPYTTNVGGTERLVALCRRLGISEFHYVSTAFVCGETDRPVLEDELIPHPRFHNVYEESKYEAEHVVRAAEGMRSTIYRPAVIVGDSRTGFTSSYHGIYRFIELAARLAEAIPTNDKNRRRLDLRLPLTGDEPRNLVPVDWVARAIAQLVNRPDCQGQTYHLVSSQPTPARMFKEVAEQVLRLDGVCFAGPEVFADGSPLERLFLDNLEEYWPYLHGDPAFDSRRLRVMLPALPQVPIDRALVARLVEFAVADNWGRKRKAQAPSQANRIDCREYIEEIFPARARQSSLGLAASLEVVVGIDVRGPGGGQWTCRWSAGELANVGRGLSPEADIIYHFDADTFDDLILGRQSPPDAFFAKRIDVDGDVEKALKLAVLFGRFLTEPQDQAQPSKEVADVVLDSA